MILALGDAVRSALRYAVTALVTAELVAPPLASLVPKLTII